MEREKTPESSDVSVASDEASPDSSTETAVSAEDSSVNRDVAQSSDSSTGSESQTEKRKKERRTKKDASQREEEREARKAQRQERKEARRNGSAENQPNPVWFRPLMFGFMLLGLVWIIVFYVSQGRFPIPRLGSWNILIGFGIAFVGFLMTTRWR